jgi:tRNA-dihydrouridine synthase
MPKNMKNGENRALAEKMDRMKGKMDRIAKKKDKKNAMEKLPSHVKKLFKNFIFYRLYLNLLKHLA